MTTPPPRDLPARAEARPPIVLPAAGVAGAIGAGLLAALVLPGNAAGLGVTLALLALAAAAAWGGRPRLSALRVAQAAVGVALAAVPLLRDAPWLQALSVPAALVLLTCALTGAAELRSLLALPARAGRAAAATPRAVAAPLAAAAPLAGLRGPSVRVLARSLAGTLPVLVVFGLLLTSADPAFASLLDRALTPPVTLDLLPARLVLLILVAAAAVVLALLAQHPERARGPWPAAAPRARLEWVLPLASLNLLLGAFLALQAAALVGGSDYVQRTTGVTYASAAREGFGQLIVAAVLVLGVLAAAARFVPRERAGDRLLLRLLGGVLAGLTLLLLASAARRQADYVSAFGQSRARLLAATVTALIGVALALVLAAGVRLRARWLPRALIVAAGVSVLGLALINPDAVVARSAVERAGTTGGLDVGTVARLSADAVPALLRVPPGQRDPCLRALLRHQAERLAAGDAWAGTNLGRRRARAALASVAASPPGVTGRCLTVD